MFTFDTSELDNIIGVIIKAVAKLPAIQHEQLTHIGGEFVAIEKSIINEFRFEGQLQDSVGYEVYPDNLGVEIGPNVPSGNVEEGKIWGVWKGAKTRWVPIARLKAWTAMKGGSPYILQRRIAGVWPDQEYPGGTSAWQIKIHGSSDFPFPERTLSSPAADATLDRATENIAEAIDKELAN